MRFASEFYDYGSDIIAYNYFQIEKKLKNYFIKPVKYNKDLISIKTKTYSLNNITPIKKLHQYLDEIYKKKLIDMNVFELTGKQLRINTYYYYFTSDLVISNTLYFWRMIIEKEIQTLYRTPMKIQFSMHWEKSIKTLNV